MGEKEIYYQDFAVEIRKRDCFPKLILKLDVLYGVPHRIRYFDSILHLRDHGIIMIPAGDEVSVVSKFFHHQVTGKWDQHRNNNG